MLVPVSGKFMGSGQTVVGARFRPQVNGPDFALAASIAHPDMQMMHPLLRAHGNFDVVRGRTLDPRAGILAFGPSSEGIDLPVKFVSHSILRITRPQPLYSLSI
jgi:hypothetical protein